MTDLPTPAATLTAARAMLSPRVRASLDVLPAAERNTTAHAVATGAQLEAWDRALSQGQPWPDIIEYC